MTESAGAFLRLFVIRETVEDDSPVARGM